jgi:hypothetical protein
MHGLLESLAGMIVKGYHLKVFIVNAQLEAPEKFEQSME